MTRRPASGPRWRVAVAVTLAGLAAPWEAMAQARVGDPGPGAPGRIVVQVTRGPHTVVVARERWALLGAADASDRSLIIVRGSARVDTRVDGDVVVVDGDLRLGRGAVIAGRAVAIGGHVYRTPFAVVRGGVLEFPDDRFEATPAGAGWRLAWGRLDSQFATPPVRLPGFAGFRVAAYSRVDGLGLTWGPQLGRGPLVVRPQVTWRTHRGAIDPAIAARLGSRRVALEAVVERTTASNEGWIAGDLASAGIGLLSGVDLRNWYRADRADVRVRVLQDRWPVAVEAWAGAREALVSPASGVGPAGMPWTMASPTPGNGFDRPNPLVPRQRLTTAVGGVAFTAPSGARVTSRLAVEAEVTALEHDAAGRFTQVIADWTSRVSTGGRTRLETLGRAAWHDGALPPARWGALGGPGTLLTEPVLALRGPRLAFASARWACPLGERTISPVVALRAARGLAGDALGWQRAVTNVGAQVDVGPVRLEYAWDPAARRGVTVLQTSWVPAW